jgi:hypothetical protein
MGAGICRAGFRAQRQALEARATEAERALRESEERLRVESEMRLELEARVGQQRLAEAGDLQLQDTSGSPEPHVEDGERGNTHKVTGGRLMPHHVRTRPEVEPAARGEVMATGQQAAEVGPHC